MKTMDQVGQTEHTYKRRDLKPDISVITLNLNVQNAPVKKQRILHLTKVKQLIICPL